MEPRKGPFLCIYHLTRTYALRTSRVRIAVALMETLRDTAFGKLVRLASRYKWMQYPEEHDASVWPEYLKTETKEREESFLVETDNEDLETYGLYAVISQCSSRPRRMSTASTIGGRDRPLVISWRGANDPEVGLFSILRVSFLFPVLNW